MDNGKDPQIQQLHADIRQLQKVVMMLNNRLTLLERQNRSLRAKVHMAGEGAAAMNQKIKRGY